MNRSHLVLKALIFSVLGANGAAKDYYVSPRGDDANPGTKDNPFRSIEKINSIDFQPGDSILFEGGQTFTGTLVLDAADSGEPGKKLTVTSYGSGRAVIDGGFGRAISIDGCNHVVIRNLRLKGSGRKSDSTESGLWAQSAEGLEVDEVEVWGFRRNGIHMNGVADVRITRVHAHDNGKEGIGIMGPARSRDVYIGYCLAENNPGDPSFTKTHSGSGIFVGYTDVALIEYCEARFNGWDMGWRGGNGPVGIWAWQSDRVVMQYNVSHHNRSTTGDGGGFDLDGGVTNSIIQYNYSHNNFGPGYLICQVGRNKFSGNIVRYNISQDDGLKTDKIEGRTVRQVAAIRVWIGGENMVDTLVHNNTIFNSQGAAVDFGGNEAVTRGTLPVITFCNNIFATGGPQIEYHEAPRPLQGVGRFVGNLYYGLGGRGFHVDHYTDINEWAAATGQEKVRDRVVGIVADPLLSQGGIGLLMDPKKLTTLYEYQLLPGSPAIDRGLDVKSLFGVDPGVRDYYGNPLPAAGSVDLGAHEYQPAP
ncbi:MAG TPA: right-handed parallel beta-helix repeat-containing protein [Acidobacteriota bacterium]|nr:right-handed parallel beta-helix repeat-containing protein [Acidobacteriota bacterium]